MKKTLDLHGFSHEDARIATLLFVEDNLNSLDDLRIITGHSFKMKAIVRDVLKERSVVYNDFFDDINSAEVLFWLRTAEV